MNIRQLLIIIALSLVKQGYSQDATNYALIDNWAVLPSNLPKSLLNTIHDSTLFESIDVFYVYPTLLTDLKDPRWNINVQDSIHRKDVLDFAIKFQASVWAESGRMYVPYYQQAHIRSYDSLENGGRDALLFAYADIKAAFEYYLKNYNHGRGIILAGHSQGSTHIDLLLKDFFDGNALQKQLVIAYLPGIGIPSNEFNTIPFLINAKEIGGFVTWNTFKKKLNHEKYEKWYFGKAVVNPITWDLSPLSKKSQQKGFYYNNGKKYKHIFQTELISGGLVLSKLRFPFSLAARKMNDFHIGDINLFWENIRQNSKQRGQEWVLKNTP